VRAPPQGGAFLANNLLDGAAPAFQFLLSNRLLALSCGLKLLEVFSGQLGTKVQQLRFRELFLQAFGLNRGMVAHLVLKNWTTLGTFCLKPPVSG